MNDERYERMENVIILNSYSLASTSSQSSTSSSDVFSQVWPPIDIGTRPLEIPVPAAINPNILILERQNNSGEYKLCPSVVATPIRLYVNPAQGPTMLDMNPVRGPITSNIKSEPVASTHDELHSVTQRIAPNNYPSQSIPTRPNPVGVPITTYIKPESDKCTCIHNEFTSNNYPFQGIPTRHLPITHNIKPELVEYTCKNNDFFSNNHVSQSTPSTSDMNLLASGSNSWEMTPEVSVAGPRNAEKYLEVPSDRSCISSVVFEDSDSECNSPPLDIDETNHWEESESEDDIPISKLRRLSKTTVTSVRASRNNKRTSRKRPSSNACNRKQMNNKKRRQNPKVNVSNVSKKTNTNTHSSCEVVSPPLNDDYSVETSFSEQRRVTRSTTNKNKLSTAESNTDQIQIKSNPDKNAVIPRYSLRLSLKKQTTYDTFLVSNDPSFSDSSSSLSSSDSRFNSNDTDVSFTAVTDIVTTSIAECTNVSDGGGIDTPVSSTNTATHSTNADTCSTNTDTRCTNTDTRNINTDTRCINTDTRSIDTDTSSIDTDIRSIDTDTRSTDTDTRSTNTDTRCTNTYTHRTNTDTRSIDTDTRSIDTDTRSTDTDTHSTNTDTRCTNTDTHRTNTDTRCTNTDTHRTNTDTRSIDTDTRSIDTDTFSTDTDTSSSSTKCDDQVYSAVTSTTTLIQELVQYRNEIKKNGKHFANLLYNTDNSGSTEVANQNTYLKIKLFQLNDDLDLTDENYAQVCELLYMCKKFGGSSNVHNQLRAYLWTHMNPNNVWTLILFTNLTDEPQLKKNAWEMVELCTTDVLNLQGFLSIPGSVLLQIVQKDVLSCNEIELLYACVRWARHTRGCFATYTQYIRYRFIDINQVMNSSYLTSNEKNHIQMTMQCMKNENPIAKERVQGQRKIPNIDTFHVFGHPSVKSPICDYQQGQRMKLNLINSSYASAKIVDNQDFILLGIEVNSQISNTNKTYDMYDEHFTVFIFNSHLKILLKKDFKQKNVPFNTIIEVPFDKLYLQIKAHEKINAIIIFHKTGTYSKKSNHTESNLRFNAEFGEHNHVVKNYSNVFECIESFVLQYTS